MHLNDIKSRGLGVQGFKPLLRNHLNPCKPLSMLVSGIYGQGFREVPGVQTPTSPCPCGFQRSNTFLCSKEQARTGVRLASSLWSKTAPCKQMHIN